MRAFALWFRDAAERSQVTHPDAACLSTVDADGQPEGRMVLVKGMDDHGISFFTNYESAKGRQLTVTPRAALTLYWHDLGRQVRVRGEVARLSPSESDEYFRTRPRGSQIGAWASEQSRPVEDRAALEARVREVADRFAEREVPRPPHWGGFLLQPREIEFWQAAEDRLHDRILYRRAPGGAWTAQRLFP
ncbi:MAG: pyridoxamine 5'-phosphate oxidase [Gemmatimonadetes bacterium]|nr:pyridoxamine 5'-phosphate oxidase [Gemmatimonadota bacterium]